MLSFMLDTGDTLLNKIETVSSFLSDLSQPFFFVHGGYRLWETGIWTSRFIGGVDSQIAYLLVSDYVNKNFGSKSSGYSF